MKQTKQKKIPLRMCLGCSEMKSKREMIRVVKSKEGEVSLDLTRKKAGSMDICQGLMGLYAIL